MRIIVCVILIFIVSCGEVKNLSTLEKSCLIVVDKSEELMEKIQSDIERVTLDKESIAKILNEREGELKVSEIDLFQCQSKLMAESSRVNNIRELVIAKHHQIISFSSVISIYKNKLDSLGEKEIYSLVDRLKNNLKFIDD